MDRPEHLSGCQIAIVGLGLMGGSLALALRDKCAGLLGVDSNPETVAQALSTGVYQAGSTDPAEVIPPADLVVLAVPVTAILDLIHNLPNLHPGSPVIIDLGSTKRQVVQAMAALPSRFDPLGGHPMCGKEKTGFANASAGLYRDAAFALVSLPRTSQRARRLADELVCAAGARPSWLPEDSHDRWVAATSHLPYLLACALALSTPLEAAPLIGPGFRSTSRVAATTPEVMLDILSTNTDEVLSALDALELELKELKRLIRKGEWGSLVSILQRSAARQGQLSGGVK